MNDVAGLGTLQQTQEVYGRGQTWRLTRLWYEQALGRASIKVGRSNVGEDFATFSCDFMNLSFCGAQPGNIVGGYWFNWPVGEWMACAKLSMGDGYVQLGAYEVNPRNLHKRFTIGYLHGATGVLLPVEGVWKPKLGGLPGTWRAGDWYDTSRADDVVLDRTGGLAATSGLDPLRRDGRWGGWAILRQQVTGTADKDGTVRGPTLFARATEADRRTARLDSQISLGLFYEGLNGVAPTMFWDSRSGGRTSTIGSAWPIGFRTNRSRTTNRGRAVLQPAPDRRRRTPPQRPVCRPSRWAPESW